MDAFFSNPHGMEFGSYQTNIELFIAVGAAALFLYKERDFKRLFLVCLKVVLPFLGAFIINKSL